MSLSSTFCHPRTLEPSNPNPVSNISSVNAVTGIVVWPPLANEIDEPKIDGLDICGSAFGNNFFGGHRELSTKEPKKSLGIFTLALQQGKVVWRKNGRLNNARGMPIFNLVCLAPATHLKLGGFGQVAPKPTI